MRVFNSKCFLSGAFDRLRHHDFRVVEPAETPDDKLNFPLSSFHFPQGVALGYGRFRTFSPKILPYRDNACVVSTFSSLDRQVLHLDGQGSSMNVPRRKAQNKDGRH